MTPLLVHKAVVCEDVRAEVGGKFFLIGVYPGNSIVIPSVPRDVAFALYTEVSYGQSGRFSGQSRICNSQGAVIRTEQISFATDGRLTALYMRSVAFMANTFDRFLMQWNFEE
jgi:hypothetical protein